MLWYRRIIAFFSFAFMACSIDVSPNASDSRAGRPAEERDVVAENRDSGDNNAEDRDENIALDSAVSDAGIDAERDAAPCEPQRWILTGEVSNARDLGGTPLESGSSVACGLLFRGSMLSDLSQRGCEAFAQLGIRTVIDLRTTAEVDSYSEAQCIEETARIVRAPLPTPYSVSPQDYLNDLYTADSIVRAFDGLGDPLAYPIYINCVHGRDRTGVLIAVVLLALGATPDVILTEYELTREAGLSTYPDSLVAVFDEIEQLGGVENYLAEMGVTKDQIDTLRSRLIGLSNEAF